MGSHGHQLSGRRLIVAEVLNLRQARKAKARAAAAAVAAANRAKFGQTKAERSRQKAETARADKLLEGARLDGDE